MLPASPVEALGSHAQDVRELVVEAVRSRHDHFAEAHQVSGSRYAMGFGSQWRDLIVDVQEALGDRGYQPHKLLPAGYRLPVVGDCLVHVWRVPDSANGASSFASSPTRVNGFRAPLPDPMLFEAGFTGEEEQTGSPEAQQRAELQSAVRAADDVMHLVLVMVRSSPRQLQSIEWAIARLDEVSGKVTLRGHESIWAPELTSEDAATDVESFDSGTPQGPTIEPQEQEGKRPDA